MQVAKEAVHEVSVINVEPEPGRRLEPQTQMVLHQTAKHGKYDGATRAAELVLFRKNVYFVVDRHFFAEKNLESIVHQEINQNITEVVSAS